MTERGKSLVDQLAAAEAAQTEVLAACIPGRKVRSRIEGLVRTWRVEPPDTEGFFVLRARDATTLVPLAAARPAQIEQLLSALKPVRVALVRSIGARTWLGVPFSDREIAARAVHLVDAAQPFDVVTARYDGALLFHEADRSVDPRVAEQLRAAFAASTLPERLAISGLTPAQRRAYDVALVPYADQWRHARAVGEIEEQIRRGGGQPVRVVDSGSTWQVTFRDRANTKRTVWVMKDLTVTSAGICLSGQDQDFDLASIIGVLDGDDPQDW